VAAGQPAAAGQAAAAAPAELAAAGQPAAAGQAAAAAPVEPEDMPQEELESLLADEAWPFVRQQEAEAQQEEAQQAQPEHVDADANTADEAGGEARCALERWFWLALGAGAVELARACYKLLRGRHRRGLLDLRHEFLNRTPLHVLVTRHLFW
jgi:hypothetical protein